MNIKIVEKSGFREEVDCVILGLCPLCRKEVREKEFRNQLDWMENEISGLCKKCIDEIFCTKLNND